MHLGQRVEVTRIVGNSPNHFQPLSILFQDARTTSEMSSSRKVLEKLFVAGELEKRYKCIQCHNVLQDPVQSSCGHRFCRLCLEDLFKREPSETKCPDDGEVLKGNEVFRDKCAEKELLALECYCSNKSLGCSWTGLLAHLDDHDAECPFTKVKCLFCKLGCDAVVLRHQLAKHVENDCLFKVVDCPYCQVGFAGVKMREHLEECGKFPVKCPHGCDESEIPREKLPEHSKSCPRAPIQCDFSYMGCDFQGPKHSRPRGCDESEIPREMLLDHTKLCPHATVQYNYSSMGCDFQGARESLEQHLCSNTTEHLKLSSKHVEKVLKEMQNLQLRLTNQQAVNQTHEAQLTIQNEALVLNKQTISTLQVKLARLEESFDELHHSVESMVNSRKNKRASLNSNAVIQDEGLVVLADEVARINAAPFPCSMTQEYQRASFPNVRGSNHQFDRVEHSLALHEIQLADQDLKLQILETTSHDGVFLWKIDKFHRRFRKAVDGKTISIYSPPFYTSRYGYKLCACVYLNGYGPAAKGKYLSLFVVLMQGENDRLLSWPFQQKITMMLLDEEQVPHVTETFHPDPSSPSFQQPCSEMNTAFGSSTFCPHHLLRSRGYIHDDSIFIKVVVDTTGMLM